MTMSVHDGVIPTMIIAQLAEELDDMTRQRDMFQQQYLKEARLVTELKQQVKALLEAAQEWASWACIFIDAHGGRSFEEDLLKAIREFQLGPHAKLVKGGESERFRD